MQHTPRLSEHPQDMGKSKIPKRFIFTFSVSVFTIQMSFLVYQFWTRKFTAIKSFCVSFSEYRTQSTNNEMTLGKLVLGLSVGLCLYSVPVTVHLMAVPLQALLLIFVITLPHVSAHLYAACTYTLHITERPCTIVIVITCMCEGN